MVISSVWYSSGGAVMRAMKSVSGLGCPDGKLPLVTRGETGRERRVLKVASEGDAFILLLMPRSLFIYTLWRRIISLSYRLSHTTYPSCIFMS